MAMQKNDCAFLNAEHIGQIGNQGIAQHPDYFRFLDIRRYLHGHANASGKRLAPGNHHTKGSNSASTRYSAIRSKRNATSGDKSMLPIGGMILRKGRIRGSVKARMKGASGA